ncbi:MAG: TIM barrel protein [Gemmatimonadales bacterium]|nr:TIM barrel protein [Gemmatimonadales bacterium]
MHRRGFLRLTAGAAGALTFQRGVRAEAVPRTGRLKQSVCRWIYERIPLADFCRAARGMGLVAIDLLQPEEWPVAADNGLVCSMGYPTARRDFIRTGFNDSANHPMLLRELEQTIPAAARAGVPNVIAMFGNRQGRTDAEGIDNCVAGLNRIKALAEERGVTICLELLNSRMDHRDYMGDRTAFGVAVVRAVNSSRVKLLYDIYHMQIMEGDVIRTIRDNAAFIAHYHTGGVPGRHELDATQELNYRAIAQAIADTGFTGYVAHEFIPVRDPLTSLREAVQLCDV